MKIRHTILVITYNQAGLISECLDSLINQSVAPYEVIICDDCSTDNTCEVVQKYVNCHPDIIKLYLNEFNLGVFNNINKIKMLATGDFINFVSGDDILPAGALEKYSEFIKEKDLDCSESFVIYSNCLILSPDGNTRRVSNQKVIDKYGVFESTALNCLWGWDTGISRGLLDIMLPMETQIGYQADLLWHFDKVVKAKRHFYIPIDGYIYRENVGVTANTRLYEHYESKRKVVAKIYECYGDRISSKIHSYFDFDEALNAYVLNPGALRYWHLVKCYFKAGSFRPNNIYKGKIGILVPYWAKNVIKKVVYK